MSYSFSVIAGSKAAAKQMIADVFANVVAAQPIHAADRDPAIAAGQAFVDALVDPSDSEEIVTNMSGSLGWRDSNGREFTSSSVNVAAHVRSKSQ